MEKRILLIEKVTELEHHQAYSKVLKFKRRHEDKMIKLLKNHEEHKEFTSTVENLFKSRKASYDKIKSNEINETDFKHYGFIVTSGGDGTFLQAAEKINNQLIIGLNSVYTGSNRGSAGGLTTVNRKNLYEIEKIFAKKYHIQQWRRLYAKVNDDFIDNLAVNDIYIGHPKAYIVSHLEVLIEPESECFLSSGIVISTGMGSHAWFRSVGGTQFRNELDVFGIVIREPFEKKEKYKFTSKILSEREKIIIYPNRDHYVIVFDSKGKEYPVTIEDYITIGLSGKSINVINFD